MVVDLLPILVVAGGLGLLFLVGPDSQRPRSRLTVRLRHDGRREVVGEQRAFHETTGDEAAPRHPDDEPNTPGRGRDPRLLPLTLLTAPPVLLTIALLT